ncbi:MAG: OmpA family protein, partial [Geobacter sp.]|nr:OmpA family protein [Geobacter sp.]
LLLPACAINTTSTTLVPGKELSRQSLGTKTTTDRVDLTVINPYTVSIKKVQCTVEQLNVAYQGLTEIKHETYPLDCSDAYLEYVVQNATTLGVPFLYDTFTGFYIFRDKCIRKAPVTMVSTRESKEIIRQEIDDRNSTTCKETPIAGALVKAELSSNVLDLVTDRDGKASLPTHKLAELEKTKSNSPIKFSYEASVAETVYIPMPKPEQNRIMRADLNGISENEAAGQQPESDSMAMLTPEDSMATKSDSRSNKPDSDPSRNKMLRKDLNSASDVKPDNQDTQMMAKLNDEIAIKKGEAKKSSPVESDLQVNKMSKDMNSVAGAKKDGTDMMAKRDTENAAMKAGPALTPLSLDTSNATTAGSGNGTQGQSLPAEADELKPRLVVYFDVNKTTVKKEFRGKLKELADEIKANSALSTSIEGHTDNTGSAEINLKMSLKRAEAIKNYLVKTLGVPEKRIKVKGFGLTRPIRSNDTESGRSANRRTEVIIITQLSAI